MNPIDDLNRLPLKNRVAFYRDRAVRAAEFANDATDQDARHVLLALAREWLQLADLCEGVLYQ